MFFSKTYLKAFTISFILLMGSLLVGAIIGYKFEGDAEHVVDERNNFYDQATVVSLYLENLKSTCPIVIPGIGITIFIMRTYNTGWVLGVHALRWRESPLSVTLESFIWNFPEFSAYLVMLTENIFITYLLFLKKDRVEFFKRIRVDTWKSVLHYLCILLIAAVWEYHFVL